MKKLLTFALLALAMSCAPANDKNTGTQTESTGTESAATASQPAPAPAAKPAEEEKPMSYYENKIAELHTSLGEIDLQFFPDVAPGHVKNFIDLSEKGFYNGTKFHRVIAGFVIQGGDPNTISGPRSTWGTGSSGKNLPAEFNSIHHARGILSMARSTNPNSASSQFFICVADVGQLDNQYTVFGRVTKGMDVADKIIAAAKGTELPSDPVTLEKVVIREAKTDAEKAPAPKS
ncbi:MAG TPA: peptidylprolyl isomerase [Thermoanaerobaculia bacterium]|nr:peptidylprolyl isomerase [Thermoanaerobaculia bacterium]